MPGQIILSDVLIATNADILQGTRLQTVPAGGVLLFEIQAADNDATNNFTFSLQMPGGDTPVDAIRAPCGNTAGLAGVLDDRTAFIMSATVMQGGHAIFSCVETGDTELSYRVTYSPTARSRMVGL